MKKPENYQGLGRLMANIAQERREARKSQQSIEIPRLHDWAEKKTKKRGSRREYIEAVKAGRDVHQS